MKMILTELLFAMHACLGYFIPRDAPRNWGERTFPTLVALLIYWQEGGHRDEKVESLIWAITLRAIDAYDKDPVLGRDWRFAFLSSLVEPRWDPLKVFNIYEHPRAARLSQVNPYLVNDAYIVRVLKQGLCFYRTVPALENYWPARVEMAARKVINELGA